MNSVILKAQHMTAQQFKDIKKPCNGKPFKKIFFQCELRKFNSGDAVFGLVAYGGYKKSSKECGPRVPLADDPTGTDKIVTDWPLVFGNLEFGIKILKSKKTKGDVYRELLKIIRSKKKDLNKILVQFKPGVSNNPHVDYTITLGTSSEYLNPCPPETPSDF